MWIDGAHRLLVTTTAAALLACGGGPERAAVGRANHLLEEGQAEEALAAYRDGRETWPEAAVFPYGEGVALYTLERFTEAEAPLREAIHLAPDEGIHHPYLGHVLSALRRYDGAVVAYEEMTRLEPLEPRGWKALGTAHYNRRSYAEARQALERYLAFARDAEDFEAMRRLIQTLPVVQESE